MILNKPIFEPDVLCLTTKACLLQFDNCTATYKNLLYKKVEENKFIGKPYVQKKDLSLDWIENTKVENIDTRYYNLDYTKK